MYTDDDLNLAVDKGVFSGSSVEAFRHLVSETKNSPAVDEENFKLIGGFNDIFIVIACGLLLFSSFSVLDDRSTRLAFAVVTVVSWVLAEFFVRKRKMALPAIGLLLAFVGGIIGVSFSIVPLGSSDYAPLIAAVLASVAAYCHWLRFRVPITIAVGTASGGAVFVASLIATFPNEQLWLMPVLFCCGALVFIFAMYWDSIDTTRTSYRSDVAFWLHLLSAPLIIHPIFSSLGILNGNESLLALAVVLLMYLLMTGISITIDRRAFMVSSLVYVLYALSSIIKTYGGIGYSFALTGVFMGAALLLLSAYWHRVRAKIVCKLPAVIAAKIPS